MVLFDDVVEVPYGSTTTASTELARPSQFGYGLPIRRIPVHVDLPSVEDGRERKEQLATQSWITLVEYRVVKAGQRGEVASGEERCGRFELVAR